MNNSHLHQHKQVYLNPHNTLPKTYFELMQKVGDGGKYQKNLFYIFVLIFLVTGTILLSTSFVFLNNRYQCQGLGLLSTQCKKLICQINDLQQRKRYFLENQQNIKSVATQYGPFMCQDQLLLDIIKSCPYFGSLLGFIIFSYFSDNFGRRTTMIITLSVASLGCVLISTGINLAMIAVGVVLAGAGINSSSGMCFIYLSQVVQNVQRQKYSILIQVSYTVGAILITGLYYFISNWRVVSVIIQTLPILIILFIFVMYAQQTPVFLLKKSNQQALKAFNRIGYINFKVKDILTEQDIQNVRSQQLSSQRFNKKKVSPLDLIRFKSLRSTTILSCLLCYIVFSLYYGPSLIIDTIGFNMFVSNIAILTSQMIGYIPCYLYVDKVKRKTANIGLFTVTILSSLILVFVQKPQECDMCIQSIIQLIIIFIFRFAVSIQFVFFLVYIIELFPTRIVGIGNGAISIAGTLASTLSPIILGSLQRIQFNLFLLFLIFGIIGVCGSILLDQTFGKPIQAQIQEVRYAKNKRKSQYISQIQSGQIINSKIQD